MVALKKELYPHTLWYFMVSDTEDSQPDTLVLGWLAGSQIRQCFKPLSPHSISGIFSSPTPSPSAPPTRRPDPPALHSNTRRAQKTKKRYLPGPQINLCLCPYPSRDPFFKCVLFMQDCANIALDLDSKSMKIGSSYNPCGI